MNTSRFFAVFISVILYLNTLQVFCQNVALQWARSAGGVGSDGANCIQKDINGNIYTTGFFEGTVDFDPQETTVNITSTGDRDIFIQKLNPDGTFLWAKTIGGPYRDEGYSIVTDSLENVYITGHIGSGPGNDVIDLDPGTGVYTITSGGGGNYGDLFILKLNRNGNFVWAKHIGNNGDELGNSITMDSKGNIWVAGTFGNNSFSSTNTLDFDPGAGFFNLTTVDVYDVFLLKLSSTGDFLWATSYGSASYDMWPEITSDKNGNIYLLGDFGDAVTFNTATGVVNMSGSMATLKVENNGNIVWAKQTAGWISGYSIAVDKDMNVYTAGNFGGPNGATVDFDPGPGVFNLHAIGGYSHLGGDLFIQKLDSVGNFLWANAIGGDMDEYCNAITTDLAGNVYAAGNFGGPYGTGNTVDFNPGADTFNLTSNGKSDGFILKLTPAGNFIWVKQFGGPGEEFCKSLAASNQGNVYVSGFFGDTIGFNSDTCNCQISPVGGIDIYSLKFIACLPTRDTIEIETLFGSITLNGHRYTESGVYTQELVNQNGCDSILTVVATVPETNNNTGGNNFRIFPNPANGPVSLRFENLQSDLQIRIQNLAGNIIYNENFGSTDNVNLNMPAQPGIYFVTVISDQGTETQRFISQ
jgi:hypothetical protein